MNRWRHLLRAYPTLLRIGFAEAVAYRAEFLVWMLATTMPLVMLAIMTAMAREAPVGNFTQQGFVGYYLATLIVRNMSGAWVAWEMTMEIKQGVLGMRLLRPIHPIASYTAQSLAALPMRALLALPLTVTLLIMFARHDLTRDPALIAIFMLSIMGAWALNFAVSAIIGAMGLFLDSAMQVWELWFGCFMLLSGYLIPLSLFPHWLERAARVLPFAYLQAFPVETLLGMHDRLHALEGLAMQLGWATVGWIALLIVWKRGLKRYAAFGG